jgi:hypothetical protein
LRYAVHIPDAEQSYLDGLPLSELAKEKVADFIDYAISQMDDAFRNDPINRLQPNKPYFQRSFLLYDVWGDRRFHLLNFVVNDEHAPYGVLIIVYVEHQ